MRVEFRTLISLALCAAASAAALAHFAIDVVGDFALRHDAYDGLTHGSREYAAAIAVVFAIIAAARGLHACCDLAQHAKGRIAKPKFTASASAGYAFVVIAAACIGVPAMEWLDSTLAGVSLAHPGDAFGGSLLLGLATTLSCAAFVAAILYVFARWLLDHRDVIVAIVATLLQRRDDVALSFHTILDQDGLHSQSPSPAALFLAKRGPPVALLTA